MILKLARMVLNKSSPWITSGVADTVAPCVTVVVVFASLEMSILLLEILDPNKLFAVVSVANAWVVTELELLGWNAVGTFNEIKISVSNSTIRTIARNTFIVFLYSPDSLNLLTFWMPTTE